MGKMGQNEAKRGKIGQNRAKLGKIRGKRRDHRKKKGKFTGKVKYILVTSSSFICINSRIFYIRKETL